jgi:hypothetical protein
MSSDSVPSVLGGLPEVLPSFSLGPEYSLIDNIKTPDEIGVRSDGSIDAVIDSVNGVNYYMDTIAFGKNVMSRQSGMKPLGVRTWVKTGQKCSNGADMWSYLNLIPEGNVFGEKVKQAFQKQNQTLQGLGPGILEDIKDTFDPSGIASSLLGTGFAKCKRVALIVGDQDNKIEGTILEKNNEQKVVNRKVSYVDEKDKPFVKNMLIFDPVTGKKENRKVLSKWMFDKGITQEQFDKEPKLFCPDGFLVSAHIDNNCKKSVLMSQIKEGYRNYNDSPITLRTKMMGILAIGGLFVLAYKLKGRTNSR